MKARDWKWIMVFIVLCMLSFVLTGYVKALQPDPLAAAMAASGFSLSEYSVHGWSKVNSQGQRQSPEELMKAVLAELGQESEGCTIDRHSTDSQQVVTATFKEGRQQWRVVAEQISRGSPKAQGLYLVLQVEGEPEQAGAYQVQKQRLEKIIGHFGVLPRINTCLTGYLDGKLMSGECELALEKAFKGAGGMIVDKLNKGDFLSYTGFSPSICEFVQIGDTRMNLNVAMRYSQYDQRTYLLIGSPVITKEY